MGMHIRSDDPNLPLAIKQAIADDDAKRRGRPTIDAVLEGTLAAQPKRKRLNPPPFNGGNKYHAVPTIADGIRFPSKAEADYYVKLKLLMQAGEVSWFARQPRFPIEGGEYVADFIVAYARKPLTGQDFMLGWIEVVDVKGFKTPVYERSKKQMKARYGIEIVEVRQ